MSFHLNYQLNNLDNFMIENIIIQSIGIIFFELFKLLNNESNYFNYDLCDVKF